MRLKAKLTGLSLAALFLLALGCETDQTPTSGIEKKVDSLNEAVMEQLKKDSTRQVE